MKSTRSVLISLLLSALLLLAVGSLAARAPTTGGRTTTETVGLAVATGSPVMTGKTATGPTAATGPTVSARPVLSERDPIDGYLFAIDCLMDQAGPMKSGVEWLAVDTTGMVHLDENNDIRFFAELERHGLKLIQMTEAELVADGSIRDGVFENGLLVAIRDKPFNVPFSSLMVLDASLKRSNSAYVHCPLRIGFFNGAWIVMETGPSSIA